MKEASNKYKYTNIEMLTVPVLVVINKNVQTSIPKSMVSDLEWFNGNQMKFEDWWRKIQLFLKSNRVIKTNNRITTILAYLKEGIAEICIQKKLDELDKELGTQNQNDFMKEIKTTFNNKIKTADAEWRIKFFK